MNFESLKAGQGVEAIESRVRQIETMLVAIQQNKLPQPAANGLDASSQNPTSFSAILASQQKLNPNADIALSSLNRLSTASSVSGKMLESSTDNLLVNPFQSAQLNLASLNRSQLEKQKPFQEAIQFLSTRHGVDSHLVNSLIKQESGFRANIVSSAGAMGLMQLMPATAKSLGVQNPNDPNQNLDGGIRYLKQLLTQFNGNVPLALAAYNAGPNAVNQYGGIPPYPETQRYVKAILSDYLKQRTS